MKARKGDLILVERTDRSYRIGAPTAETTSYEFGIVHSATRDGDVKTWSAVGYGDELHSEYGQKLQYGQRRWVMPKSGVDVPGVLRAAKAHHWPGHPGQPMPFDSFEEAREAARPYKVTDAAA